MSVASLVALEGGKNMSMIHDNTEAGIGLPLLDTHHQGIFKTATFALG